MMGNKNRGALDSETQHYPQGLGLLPHRKMCSPFSDKGELHVIKLDLPLS